MTHGEQRQQATAPGSSSRGRGLRAMKWIVIVLVLLFLVTRVIRFFLQ
jgi:hypothetical protein